MRFILSLCLCLLPLFAIENYEVFVKQYKEDKTLLIITRRFELKGKTFYLTTNTQTLQSKIMMLDASKLTPLNEDFFQSNFAKALSLATNLPQKGGVTQALTKKANAIYLTMDLCPSSKKEYESGFINTLTEQNGKTPIAIAITSAWINHHEKEFQSLLNNPLLDITWVNHTHTHFYDSKLPDHENFMLHENTDVKSEILGVEKKLVARGITPSVFFRFPGLMANEKLMNELKENYFLIPLGANAWIAKNETVKSGSFILIHGNKNEHQGIEILESMLPDLLKHYTFKTIKEAFVP